ncbi:hypothetical protein COU59_03805 [Candidatus Pacearchaeota archaeon CG10_big_fil_rev_8_21_14_0_10_34_12]|nr:MAG: hypothetical protein COU59_03805 [Candidatus Pacearchaeota archaeon CG10_big_fil_rev_8_21_14_0_10_34_12]
MVEEKGLNYESSYGDAGSGLQINDLQEKQNILKDRLLLIGGNLVEIKEETGEKIIEIKKEVEIMKHDIERIKSFLDSLSGQMGKFAKKEDLEILSKQAKMFQPFIK